MKSRSNKDSHASLIRAIEERARPLRSKHDLQPLIEQISQARIVMLGEASHGTQEFYEWRRLISEWLIVKHGFRFITVEGDWPPCYEVNRYIRAKNNDGRAKEVLSHFNRWPTWMWANTEVVKLVEWMKSHNGVVADEDKIGFYGLDVYSLFESIDEVLRQLERINPFLARRARIRYQCFDRFHRDEKAYVRSLIQFPEGCEIEAIESLEELLGIRLEGATKGEERDSEGARESLFDAQQNARIVANAEDYYRAMIHGDEESWNIRDRHMLETLDILLSRFGKNAKAIVWAHNTHIGDYHATDMAVQGQVNIGGLAREKWGEDQIALVGFGTYQGEVIASHAWDGPIETLLVPPAAIDSYEEAFHLVSESKAQKGFYLKLKEEGIRAGPLGDVRGHRAIGVIYQPAYESVGNYVPTSLARRYDAFLFFDETKGLEPLRVDFKREEIPEAWPRGQ